MLKTRRCISKTEKLKPETPRSFTYAKDLTVA
jgi:hypothetical protein